MSDDLLGLLPDKLREPNPEVYLSDDYLVLDFETYGEEFGSATSRESGILLAAWMDSDSRRASSRVSKVSVKWGSEFGQNSLIDAVRRAKFIVAHNAKYELQWLYRMGCDLRGILCYCTQIGEYVLAGNRRWPLSLDQTARRYGLGGKGPLADILLKTAGDTKQIPRSVLQARCVKDVRQTHEIFLHQRTKLRDAGLLPVAYARNLVTPVLASMEFEGMVLDEVRVRDRSRLLVGEYREAETRLNEITGGINFRSPKQLGSFIYDKLAFEEQTDRKGAPIRSEGGGRKTDRETLASLRSNTDSQRAFTEAIREIIRLKKPVQILETMEECLASDDHGLIRAVFNQTVCQNHRLSSTGGRWRLQFHNFPRAFKPLFKARKEGFFYVEADAPQLEFRTAVDLARDARGRSDIRGGIDVHKLSQDHIGVNRQEAKKYTFRPLYGGNRGNRREQAYYAAFRERYGSTYRTQLGWVAEVVRNKQLRTASGLIFYWPDTEVTKSGWITNTPSIFNYPVSSFATADIIPLCLTLVYYLCLRCGVRAILVNTIHDSIVAEVHEDDVDKYKEILKFAFGEGVIILLKKLYNYDFETPLGVGIKVGKNWGEGEEEKYEYDPIVTNKENNNEHYSIDGDSDFREAGPIRQATLQC